MLFEPNLPFLTLIWSRVESKGLSVFLEETKARLSLQIRWRVEVDYSLHQANRTPSSKTKIDLKSHSSLESIHLLYSHLKSARHATHLSLILTSHQPNSVSHLNLIISDIRLHLPFLSPDRFSEPFKISSSSKLHSRVRSISPPTVHTRVLYKVKWASRNPTSFNHVTQPNQFQVGLMTLYNKTFYLGIGDPFRISKTGLEKTFEISSRWWPVSRCKVL